MTTFTDTMPLGEARDRLRDLVTTGHRCPCCTQLAKVYRRPLTSVAVRALIALWREHGTDYGHLPTVASRRMPDRAHQGGYLTLSQHWGLIAEKPETREDKGRAGWWHVTDQGRDFLHDTLLVPKYALLYDSRLLRLEGPDVGVRACLTSKFDYEDLMRGSA